MKPIRIFKNDDLGIEAHVSSIFGQYNMVAYSVCLKDTDANEFLDAIKLFQNEEDANHYAKYIISD